MNNTLKKLTITILALTAYIFLVCSLGTMKYGPIGGAVILLGVVMFRELYISWFPKRARAEFKEKEE